MIILSSLLCLFLILVNNNRTMTIKICYNDYKIIYLYIYICITRKAYNNNNFGGIKKANLQTLGRD